MNKIFKYAINPHRSFIDMPRGAKPLHAGLDPHGNACIWAEVNEKAPLVSHRVVTVGTGFHAPLPPLEHIGTYVEKPYVWHVYFERTA